MTEQPKFKSEEFATFLKKKGFIYPSSAIYGGLAGLYDYGHLGTKVKRNFENAWRDYFLSLNLLSYKKNHLQNIIYLIQREKAVLMKNS